VAGNASAELAGMADSDAWPKAVQSDRPGLIRAHGFAVGVRGHLLALFTNQAGQLLSEPIPQWLNVFMFQKKDGARQRSFVHTKTARNLKCESVFLAVRAIRDILRKFRIECSWLSADGATSRRDFQKQRKVVIADR